MVLALVNIYFVMLYMFSQPLALIQSSSTAFVRRGIFLPQIPVSVLALELPEGNSHGLFEF